MKKVLLRILCADSSVSGKFWRCMKLSFILVFVTCLQASARLSGQEMFTLSMNHVSVDKVLSKIQKQSNYRFFYNERYLRHLNPVSLRVKDAALSEVLDQLLDGSLSYKIIDKNLVIISPKLSLDDEHRITGLIHDQKGAPLVGVTVQVRGSSRGTVSDANGRFTLVVPDSTVLDISYIGYQTQEISIGNTKDLTIVMKTASSGLNEVVVIGYGTERKKDLTGAVAQVSGDVLENRSLPNLTQGLQGVIPNLNLTMMDGKPIQSPAFNVRGTTSIGQGGNALVLIDGVEGDPSMLNPNDVASVTVLKDAASAAIYGARGAFGVVLITTKSAKKGKTSVTYSSDYSFKSPTAIPDQVTNGYQWAKMFSEAWSATYNYTQIAQNVNKTQKFSQAYLDALKQHDEDPSLPKTEVNSAGEYVYYHNTDWYKLLYKPHNFAIDQNLAISGSSEKASFYITGRYYNQSGLFRYNSDNYRMYNFRAKGTVQLFPWLEIENNLSYANMTYHNPLNVGEGGAIWRNMSDEAHAMAPLLNPDGTLSYSAAYTVGDFYYGKNGIDFNNRHLTNTTGFNANFLDNALRIHGNFTFQGFNDNQTQIRVPVPYSTKPGIINYVGGNYNDLQESYGKTGYIAANLYGEYEKTLNDAHHFKVMIGYNFEQSIYDSLLMRRNGLINPDSRNISLALGQSITTLGNYDKWDLMGGFFRLNYDYKDRYLIEVNGRYDGSSKFPQDQQFGFFPSVSAGWRISQEPFWHVPEKVITDLKLRASYGSLGNGNIASYSFLEKFNISQSGRVLNGQRPQQTSSPGVIPNGLTWETSTTENLGLDAALLSSRLLFTGDAYIRRTTNMFTVGPTLPDVFGTTVPKGNYADLKTTGWEISVTWQNQTVLASKPFHYSVTLSLSDYKAVITKYNNPDKKLSDYYVGEKVGEIWGYVDDGYWTDKDVSGAAKMNANISNNSSTWLPGDIKYKDLNNDGIISHGDQTVSNPGDMKIIGNTTPRLPFGVAFNASWNSFFFSVFVQGIGKRDWYPSSEADDFWGQYNRPYNAPLKSQLNKIWSEDNPNAYFPRYRGYVALSGDRELSVRQTKYLQNAAYVRLKNIQLGYNLPEDLVSKAKITNARLYVSGENLWIWSPMFKITDHNIDPESINGSDMVLTSGTSGDAQNYPILKSVTFGLSVTF